MAHVTFYLDHPFRQGIHIKIINKHKREGKPLKQFFRDKELSIYMYMRIAPKLYKVNTNERIHPLFWNFEKSEAKSSYLGYKELNDRLLVLKSELLRKYRSTLSLNPNLRHDQIYGMIREIMVENLPNPINKDFFEIYQEFIIDRSGLVKPHTIKKYKTICTILKDFQKLEQYNVTFDSINYEFLTRFKKYLYGRKLLNDTIGKYIQGVQVFMNWTRERGIHKNMELLKVKVERDKHDVVYLTDEELTKMYDFDLSTLTRLGKVRDLFCFLAFTGQRFSDGMNLKWENFNETENNELIWNLYQIKGNKKKSVKVPIREEARQYLTDMVCLFIPDLCFLGSPM